MAVHYKTRGFIFKKEDRAEADRFFSIFTREFGRLEVFGKAIRKINSKLRGGIDLFHISDIEFIQGKNKKTLTDAVITQKFNSITDSPEKSVMAGQISNLLDDFIKGEERDEKILQLIIETFEKLDRLEPRQLMYYYFFWNFVALLGYAPEFSNMPSKTAHIITMIIKKEWEDLITLSFKKEAQKSLVTVSENYRRYLLEHIT